MQRGEILHCDSYSRGRSSRITVGNKTSIVTGPAAKRRRWRTPAETRADIFDYIEPFYNRKRLHSTVGYASPAKFLQLWINAQHGQKKAA